MRKRYVMILVALLTLAFGRVIHEPFFTAAPAAEETAVSHSQAEAIEKIVFPTTQDDGESPVWYASAQPATIDAAPEVVPTVATTQPSVEPVAMFWNIQTQPPTVVMSPSQPTFTPRNPLNNPIAMVEDSAGSKNLSDDLEGMSSGEGSSGGSHGSTSPVLPPQPAPVFGAPPPALSLSVNPFPDQNSTNPGSTVIATPSPTPEPCGFLLLAVIVFATETRRTRGRMTKHQ
jgi:hypothetical protein